MGKAGAASRRITSIVILTRSTGIKGPVFGLNHSPISDDVPDEDELKRILHASLDIVENLPVI